jgi:hypothetical protein
MTGLWTNDHDTLAKALWGLPHQTPDGLAKALIDRGYVRVLDPDETELVEQVAKGIYQHRSHEVDDWTYFIPHAIGALEALRQP